MTTIKTQGTQAGEFLLSEGPGQISRESVVVEAGHSLPAGQLLALRDNQFVPYDQTADDGSDVAVAILYGPLPASTAPRPALIIARLAEVAGARLTYFDEPAVHSLGRSHVIVR